MVHQSVIAHAQSPAEQFAEWSLQASYDEVVPAFASYWTDARITNWDRAELALLDRYFLLLYILGRHDILHPWLYERCREVETRRDGYLDLWARGHYKSTFITYAGILQEVLNDPEITVAIFSHTRPIAKAFLRQIKREFEQNPAIKLFFPHICYDNPKGESPQWSEDGGIVVKRQSNPKEATVEAWGLVDGQPISKHYDLRVYDDIVTMATVTTPEQINKTMEAVDLSQSLAGGPNRSQYIGTRYSFSDPYRSLMERKQVIPRVYAATDTGGIEGRPVFLTEAAWKEKRGNQSSYVLACQQLQNPIEGSDTAFRQEWIRWYEIRPLTLNVYIMVDPARTKKKTSDKTGMIVVGVDHAMNKYLLDGLCHRLSLSERWASIKYFLRKWRRAAGIQDVQVGYEIYGSHADFEHFREMMDIEQNWFDIAELKWSRDAPDSHVDRVQRLEPDFREGRFFLPYERIDMTEEEKADCKIRNTHTKLQQEAIDQGSEHMVATPIIRMDDNKKLYNLVDYILDEEYRYFPQVHVDAMDAMSRIYDMNPTAPIVRSVEDLLPAPEAAY